MKKLRNLNYKILSTLPVMGMCLVATSQTSNAMFRNILTSSTKTLSSISSSLSNQVKNSNQGQSVKYFYSSTGRRAIFTSSPSSTNLPSSKQNNDTKYFYSSNSRRPILLSNNTSKPNVQQHSSSNLNLDSKPKISPESSTSNSDDWGKSWGKVLGNAISPILEMKVREAMYGIKDDKNNISSINFKGNSNKTEASKWGNILSSSIIAQLQINAINKNPNYIHTLLQKNN